MAKYEGKDRIRLDWLFLHSFCGYADPLIQQSSSIKMPLSEYIVVLYSFLSGSFFKSQVQNHLVKNNSLNYFFV